MMAVQLVTVCSSLVEDHDKHACAWALDQALESFGFPQEYLRSPLSAHKFSQVMLRIALCVAIKDMKSEIANQVRDFHLYSDHMSYLMEIFSSHIDHDRA